MPGTWVSAQGGLAEGVLRRISVIEWQMTPRYFCAASCKIAIMRSTTSIIVEPGGKMVF
jgi:hypothetical protein